MRTQLTAPDYSRMGSYDRVVRLYAKQQTRYYSVFTDSATADNYNFIAGTQGNFNTAGVVAEGGQIPISDFATPFTQSYNILFRALGFEVTKVMKDRTDHYNLIRERAQLQVDAVLDAMEYDAADFINLATNAAVPTPDGLSLANAAHLLAAGTFSNIVAGNPALSVTSLGDAQNMFGAFLKHEGQPMSAAAFGGKLLVVPPALEVIAKRLIQSEKYPTTNNNEKNVVGADVELLMNPYMAANQGGSDTAWALIGRKRNPLKLYTLLPLESRQDIDKGKAGGGADQYYCEAGWCRVPEDARGFVYSAGA